MSGRCSARLLGIIACLAALAPATSYSDQGYRNLGKTAAAADIAGRDTDLAPTGRVPPGTGSVSDGESIYQAQCAHCHGARGEGGLHMPLALLPEERARDAKRLAFALDPGRPRVVGNYWPYATTVYDYIRRAMPQLAPGSLSNAQAYAVTAFVLYLNGLVDEDATLDGRALQQLEMPARRLFYTRDLKNGR